MCVCVSTQYSGYKIHKSQSRRKFAPIAKHTKKRFLKNATYDQWRGGRRLTLYTMYIYGPNSWAIRWRTRFAYIIYVWNCQYIEMLITACSCSKSFVCDIRTRWSERILINTGQLSKARTHARTKTPARPLLRFRWWSFTAPIFTTTKKPPIQTFMSILFCVGIF